MCLRRPYGTALFLALLLGCFVGPPAWAHGPTVRVSPGRVVPPVLTIRAGDTVHFHNASSSGAGCTVVADDGSFESPTLGRAEGYHHTFEEPGEVAFHLKESSKARGRVIVVAD